jgi:hypothetical protein
MKTMISCLMLIAVALMNGCVSSRQVIVYSFLTDAGRGLTTPRQEKPARCALGSGGYHEWGGVRAGEKPVTLAFVDPLVRAALRMNGYIGLRQGESPELVVLFHWGCLRPEPRGLSTGRFDVMINQDHMLDLVGARALASKPNRILQSALIEAASEERYFLIMSAYAPPNSGEELNQLLWRTQCSLPLAGTSQDRAFPILAAAGALHLGRETNVPDFITLDVEQVLRDALQHKMPRPK